MSHLPYLIADLALILISAGVITLLFKKLKQPLVLGYIVAGFLTGPHSIVPTATIFDTSNMQTWADIGVIFLLFALGLEFSFKKILKVGGTAVIAACTIIFSMIMVGIVVGISFGWHKMDCIFLGGMIAMSSTTIIYKAFDDLGLRKKKFAGLVLGILILEDILAIVLMVVLSTMAVSNNFQGKDLIESLGKLVFFLVIWFVVGIFLIPGFLKKTRSLMSDETLLIVSLGMCFGMVVLASQVGFSPAFGAFIMGSILAETIEAEHIEHLVKPVKDLFGAIFFVSVGMMVDPSMIAEYAVPIAVISLVVIIGQSVFGTFGVLLSGQPLKTAMLIVESISEDKKRIPAYGNEKVISLADIAMYTNDSEVPLREVLASVLKKENGETASIDTKKSTADQLRAYFAEILPDFDRDRVYVTDIKKLVSWYNILVTNGITDFETEETTEEVAESEAE